MTTDPVMMTAVGLTGAALLLMERWANWRLTRARRALVGLTAILPTSAQVLGRYQWREREVVAYRAEGHVLRAAAQPALSDQEEAACVSWLIAEGFDSVGSNAPDQEAILWETGSNPALG